VANPEDRAVAKEVWDAVDTSPNLAGKNVLKTFKMPVLSYITSTLFRCFCCIEMRNIQKRDLL